MEIHGWGWRLLGCVLGLLILSSHSSPSKNVLSAKRILSEYKEIASLGLALNVPFNTTSAEEFWVRLSPMKRNMLEWHFTFMGPEDSPYAGGCYHGKIVLPADYPRSAPSVSLLTKNGRWEVGKEICLSGNLN